MIKESVYQIKYSKWTDEQFSLSIDIDLIYESNGSDY